MACVDRVIVGVQQVEHPQRIVQKIDRPLFRPLVPVVEFIIQSDCRNFGNILRKSELSLHVPDGPVAGVTQVGAETGRAERIYFPAVPVVVRIVRRGRSCNKCVVVESLRIRYRGFQLSRIPVRTGAAQLRYGVSVGPVGRTVRRAVHLRTIASLDAGLQDVSSAGMRKHSAQVIGIVFRQRFRLRLYPADLVNLGRKVVCHTLLFSLTSVKIYGNVDAVFQRVALPVAVTAVYFGVPERAWGRVVRQYLDSGSPGGIAAVVSHQAHAVLGRVQTDDGPFVVPRHMFAVVVGLGADASGCREHDIFDYLGLVLRGDVHHLVFRGPGVADAFRHGVILVVDLHIFDIRRRQVPERGLRVVAEEGLPVDIDAFDLRAVGEDASVADLDARQLFQQLPEPVPGQGLESGGIVDGRISADNHGDAVAPHLHRGDLPFVLGQIHVDIADEIFRVVPFRKGFVTHETHGQLHRMPEPPETFAASACDGEYHVFDRCIRKRIFAGCDPDRCPDQRLFGQAVLHIDYCPGGARRSHHTGSDNHLLPVGGREKAQTEA